MSTAAAFEARVLALYGDPLHADAGVVHVTSVWAAPDGRWHSLRIGPLAPRSDTDAFALAVARARADVIVTTGAILRAEPRLTHDLDATAPGASAWRRECLGKARLPETVVLTRGLAAGAGLDPRHPIFAEAACRVSVVTSEAAAQEPALVEALATHRGAVVGRANPSLRDAVSWLRDERGFSTVLLEAGVGASRALYAHPVAVDELMLSIYCAEALPAEVQGACLFAPNDAVRVRLARHSVRAVVREEDSGTWRFERHRLDGAPAHA